LLLEEKGRSNFQKKKVGGSGHRFKELAEETMRGGRGEYPRQVNVKVEKAK